MAIKETITNIGEIPETEAGDLLLMAIAIITTESRTTQEPDEVLKELHKRRFDVMYTEGDGR
jgi:hypothetical protein